MTPNDYQKLAERTDKDRSENVITRMEMGKREAACLLHSAIGLSGEAGELAGVVEKWIYYFQPLNEVQAAEELGDCLWYIAQACTALGITLESVMVANIEKLKKRYPNCYTDTNAEESNRDRSAEAAIVQSNIKIS